MLKNRTGAESAPTISRIGSSSVSPQTMIANYSQDVEALAGKQRIRRLSPTAVFFAMSQAQQNQYALAIHRILELDNQKTVSPDVLFRAADLAVLGQTSETEARIGLQPGTMNPVHYGHISAALAAILAESLDLVILMTGANVPDKPYSANSTLRYEMLRLAIAESGLTDWLWATLIRQQVAEMFSQDPRLQVLLGQDDFAKRSTIDLAAFIWLFRANPKVKWTYVVGSDKISGYGGKGEYDLIVNTLADVRASTHVLYIERQDEVINVDKDISPYDWMLANWKNGFFKKSPLSTYQISASAIRTAIAECNGDAADTIAAEALAHSVLAFILEKKDLLSLYSREAALRRLNE
jgi:nicotinic acid mononucleotide adenylyltransferase